MIDEQGVAAIDHAGRKYHVRHETFSFEENVGCDLSHQTWTHIRMVRRDAPYAFGSRRRCRRRAGLRGRGREFRRRPRPAPSGSISSGPHTANEAQPKSAFRNRQSLPRSRLASPCHLVIHQSRAKPTNFHQPLRAYVPSCLRALYLRCSRSARARLDGPVGVPRRQVPSRPRAARAWSDA